jgi:hypothetical protein
VAALIKKDTGTDVELVVGGRGEFTVWVDDKVVAQKSSVGFPADEDAVAAVRRALAPTTRTEQ